MNTRPRPNTHPAILAALDEWNRNNPYQKRYRPSSDGVYRPHTCGYARTTTGEWVCIADYYDRLAFGCGEPPRAYTAAGGSSSIPSNTHRTEEGSPGNGTGEPYRVPPSVLFPVVGAQTGHPSPKRDTPHAQTGHFGPKQDTETGQPTCPVSAPSGPRNRTRNRTLSASRRGA